MFAYWGEGLCGGQRRIRRGWFISSSTWLPEIKFRSLSLYPLGHLTSGAEKLILPGMHLKSPVLFLSNYEIAAEPNHGTKAEMYLQRHAVASPYKTHGVQMLWARDTFTARVDSETQKSSLEYVPHESRELFLKLIDAFLLRAPAGPPVLQHRKPRAPSTVGPIPTSP